MARAEQYTWLPLDRWRELFGICPFSFNQLTSSAGLFPSGDCGEVFFQHAYQNTDFTSREDIAEAIRAAERNIAQEVGYHLLPDWIEGERKQTTRPARPEVFSKNVLNVRGMAKSVETDMSWVISGGIRASSLIEADAAVALSDLDGDGYSETCTVTVTTTVTDLSEIRAYYPGESGDYKYEIRPIQVTLTGGVATIVFKRWQLVKTDLLERIDAAKSANTIEISTATNYETTIDVYRVYNDPQTQVAFLWENDPYCTCGGSGCPGCSFTTQSGCIFVRDQRLGIVGYRPASWDADDSEFTTAAWSIGRDPEQVRLYYYSGWVPKDPRITRPYAELDPYWEKAIAYYSLSLLDRCTCDCNNAQRFIDYWRTDLSRQGAEVAFQVSDADLDNPLGTTMGAIYAWRQIKRDGRRVR